MDDYRKLVEKDERQIKGKSILEIEKLVNLSVLGKYHQTKQALRSGRQSQSDQQKRPPLMEPQPSRVSPEVV